MRTFFLLMSFFFCTITLSAQKKRVAVFQAEGAAISQSYKQAFVNAIQQGIKNSNQYDVFEREELENVTKENKYQLSGMVREDQILKLGQDWGADCVAFASVNDLDGNYQITCKLIEVESKKTLFVDSYYTENGKSDFLKLLPKIAKEMFAGNNFSAEVQGTKFSGFLQNGDKFTGFISSKDEASSTWEEAINLCKQKGEGWYLPSKEELQMIYYLRNSIIKAGGKNFKPNNYWSSSQRNNYDGYVVNFEDGEIDYYGKTYNNICRCVKVSE